MTEPQDLLKSSLKSHGQSLTEPRRIVFAALQGQEPQTMQQLVAACKGQIDRATVYRTTTMFERLGIIQRLQIGWKYKLELSDIFHRHHHHLTCLKCGTTFAFSEDEDLKAKLKTVALANNFQMQEHQLEIQGLCENCWQPNPS